MAASLWISVKEVPKPVVCPNSSGVQAGSFLPRNVPSPLPLTPAVTVGVFSPFTPHQDQHW